MLDSESDRAEIRPPSISKFDAVGLTSTPRSLPKSPVFGTMKEVLLLFIL